MEEKDIQEEGFQEEEADLSYESEQHDENADNEIVQHQELADALRRHIDFGFRCAKRFWYQRPVSARSVMRASSGSVQVETEILFILAMNRIFCKITNVIILCK